jgi:hypothetical protein
MTPTETPTTYGKHHIFLTITYTQTGRRHDVLLPGQTPHDQLDLLARVFRSKMKMMKEMLTKKHIQVL